MQRFEYRIETLAFKRGTVRSKTQPQEEQLATALNDWGKKGWRAVTVDFTPHAAIESTGARIVLERGQGHWLMSEQDD